MSETKDLVLTWEHPYFGTFPPECSLLAGEQQLRITKKPALITFRGLPGSGKTTIAEKLFDQVAFAHGYHPYAISKDEIRAEYKALGRGFSEAQVVAVQDLLVREALDAKKIVFVHDTNFNPVHIERWQKLCVEKGAEFHLIDLSDVPLNVCLARNEMRGESKVPERVIKDMWRKYIWKPDLVRPGSFFNWANIPPASPLPCAVIVDIDGTLAANQSRDPYDLSTVSQDAYNWHVVTAVRGFLSSHTKPIDLFVFSGREDSPQVYIDTLAWLNKIFPPENSAPCGFRLALRKAGDKRRDSVVKREMYQQYIENKYHVAAVFDDREQVIRELWGQLNVPVFRCGKIDQDGF